MPRKKKGAARAAQNKAARERAFVCIIALALVIAVLLGCYWYFFVYKKEEPVFAKDELSIHFPELGNKYTGDCIYIKINDVDILVDGGSRPNSAPTIEEYVDRYCTDGTLEYVVVTHGDRDHIAAFAGDNSHASLFTRYECETVIDFPQTGKSTDVMRRYVASREEEVKAGAAHYTALQCYREEDGAKRSYELAEGVTLEFLYNYYYEHKTDNENNYSVCFLLRYGQNAFLFTGDLESKGEEYLVQYNSLPRCVFYKAGHHGSKTSSTDALLSVIRPEIVCVCCVAGSDEYTDNGGNTFPTQDMINRVSKYTTRIYVTSLADDAAPNGYRSMNGDIVVTAKEGEVSVSGSNNSTPLPDTAWFSANRTLPQ